MTDAYTANQIREELNRPDHDDYSVAAAAKLQWMLEQLRGDIFEDDTFVDFGGNDGTCARVFADVTRCRSAVIDICEDRMAVARGRGLETMNAELDAKLPLFDNSVSWGFCSHTLEHVRDLDESLAALYRVITNGICIVVPLESDEVAAKNAAHLRNSPEPEWWQTQIERAGFVVESSKLTYNENFGGLTEAAFLCFKPEFYQDWKQGVRDPESLKSARKVDIVIAWFRQQAFWPRVLEGLQANANCINRVIVVNDEPWRDVKLDAGGLELVLLDHPRRGRGPSESFNQGVAAAATDHVLLMEGDIILPRGAILEDMPQASPDAMILRGVVRVDPLSAAVLQHDWRAGSAQALAARQRQWNLMQCNYVLCDRQRFLSLNGFDEAMCALHGTTGYSEEDTDLGVRWMAAAGSHCLKFSPGDPVIHLGGRRNTDPRNPQFTPVEAREGLVKSLGALFNGHYNLFYNDHRDDAAVNVAHLNRADGMDIRLDCIGLRWLSDAAQIDAHLPLEYFTETQLFDWINRAAAALRPGGRLRFTHTAHPWIDDALIVGRLTTLGFAPTREGEYICLEVA